MKYIKQLEDIQWEFDEEETPEYDDIFDTPLKQEFKKFLEENNALDKWLYNLRTYGSPIGSNKTHNPNEFLSNNKSVSWIKFAFYWENTQEGYYFWFDLDIKWWHVRLIK